MARRPDDDKRLDMVWFKQRFDELERQHAMILKQLEGGNLTPELEAQVRRASGLAVHIDRKVPDRNVPPSIKP